MNRFEVFSGITVRAKRVAEISSNKFSGLLNHRISRLEADKIRERVVKKNGKRFVDQNLKKHIKDVCQKRFGSSGYWHWLALYAELRGEFFEGWLPVDFYRFNLLPKWNLLSELSLFKTYDYRLFGDFAIKPALIRIKGRYYNSDYQNMPADKINDFISENFDEIVVKPDSGRGGVGTRFCDADKFRIEDFKGIDSYVIQPVIKQHRELDKLSPDSVNSIRITTFMATGSDVRMLFAYQKFGKQGNRVDHIASGGMFMKLSKEGIAVTGALGKFGFKQMDKHPLHGFEFKGFIVPSFHKALQACIKTHHKNPHIRIIGWDIAIDREGAPKLLEWNANRPGIWIAEALFGPFFNENELKN